MGRLQNLERAWLDASRPTGVLAALEALARRNARRVVLCYHGVRPHRADPFDPNGAMHVTPRRFESHLAYLTGTCAVAPLDRVTGHDRGGSPDGRVTVAISFDDGYRDNVQYALPLLEKYRCPATIFLPTSFIGTGRVFWWEQLESWIREARTTIEIGGGVFALATLAGKHQLFEHLRVRLTRAGPVRREELLARVRTLLAATATPQSSTMRWAQVESLAAGGLITFGAHTVNHVAVSSLTDDEMHYEVAESRRELARHVTTMSTIFAYPYGRHADLDPRAPSVLGMHDFAGAVTLLAGAVGSESSPFLLPRVFIERGDSVSRLRAKIAGVDAPFWLGRHMLSNLRRVDARLDGANAAR